MAKKLLRTDQVAQRLQVSEKTVSRMIASGELPSVRVSKRAVRIDPDRLQQYTDAGGRQESR